MLIKVLIIYRASACGMKPIRGHRYYAFFRSKGSDKLNQQFVIIIWKVTVEKIKKGKGSLQSDY